VSAHVSCAMVGLKDCTPPIQNTHTQHTHTTPAGLPASAATHMPAAATARAGDPGDPRGARATCPWDLRTGDGNPTLDSHLRGVDSHLPDLTRRPRTPNSDGAQVGTGQCLSGQCGPGGRGHANDSHGSGRIRSRICSTGRRLWKRWLNYSCQPP